jgi:hypothetical protein
VPIDVVVGGKVGVQVEISDSTGRAYTGQGPTVAIAMGKAMKNIALIRAIVREEMHKAKALKAERAPGWQGTFQEVQEWAAGAKVLRERVAEHKRMGPRYALR